MSLTDSVIVKSPSEIEALKRNWRSDPIWDIENTEGFEAHKGELLAYRIEQEQIWDAAELRRQEVRALALGIPENYSLLAHIERMERQIESLTAALERVYLLKG